MLKPHICAACEKIIFDCQFGADNKITQGPATLVGLFQKISVGVTADAPAPPENSFVPREWAIYTTWDGEPGDELKTYTVCMQIFYPDETPFGEAAKSQLRIELNRRAQAFFRLAGFPIGQVGFYKIHVWLELEGRRVFGPIVDQYEIEIVRQPQPQPHVN